MNARFLLCFSFALAVALSGCSTTAPTTRQVPPANVLSSVLLASVTLASVTRTSTIFSPRSV
jgi:predicted component of type VI protein secretion system